MWYYISSGVRKGPVSDDEVRQLIAGKWIKRKTLVWTAGLPAWTPLKDTALANKSRQAPPAGTSDLSEPPPLPSPDTRSLKPLWGWLRVLLVVYLLVSLANAAALYHQLEVIDRMFAGAYGSDDDMMAAATRSDALVSLASLTFLAMLIWCFFLWARITYRAMRNLKEIRAEGLTISPGWAVGFYFIPILFLWKPLQAVRQIWRSSTSPRAPDSVKVPGWVGLWWALFVISTILSNISARLTLFGGEDVSLIKAASEIDIASSMFDVLMVPLVFVLWNGITKKQEALLEGSAADPQDSGQSAEEAVLRPVPL